MNLIKKIKINKVRREAATKLITVRWKWIDSDEIYEEEGTSAGIASLMADPCIEIL